MATMEAAKAGSTDSRATPAPVERKEARFAIFVAIHHKVPEPVLHITGQRDSGNPPSSRLSASSPRSHSTWF